MHIFRLIKIQNERGLHARAAAKFVKLATQFQADVVVSKDGTSVSGRSIMGLMMLGAGFESIIEIAVNGVDADKLLTALVALVDGKFDEQ